MTEPPRRFAALAGTKGVGGNGGIEDSFYSLDGFYSLDSFYSLDGVAGPTGPSGPTELAGGCGGVGPSGAGILNHEGTKGRMASSVSDVAVKGRHRGIGASRLATK